jgi:hypothetical protein
VGNDGRVDVGGERLGRRGLEGVAGVHPDAAHAAQRLGHAVGPVVGQVLGIDLDRLGRLGEDGRAEGAGGVERLAAQGRASAGPAGGAGLGQQPFVLDLDRVVGLAGGDDLLLVVAQLVG